MTSCNHFKNGSQFCLSELRELLERSSIKKGLHKFNHEGIQAIHKGQTTNNIICLPDRWLRRNIQDQYMMSLATLQKELITAMNVWAELVPALNILKIVLNFKISYCNINFIIYCNVNLYFIIFYMILKLLIKCLIKKWCLDY